MGQYKQETWADPAQFFWPSLSTHRRKKQLYCKLACVVTVTNVFLGLWREPGSSFGQLFLPTVAPYPTLILKELGRRCRFIEVQCEIAPVYHLSVNPLTAAKVQMQNMAEHCWETVLMDQESKHELKVGVLTDLKACWKLIISKVTEALSAVLLKEGGNNFVSHYN